MIFLDGTVSPVVKEEWKLTETRFDEWLHGDILSVKWWGMLVLFAVTAFIWWKKADKTRLYEILLYTLFVMLFILALDELGEELSFWYYTTDVFPLFPPISSIDVSCLPLVYMLVYQHTHKWKSFIIATAIMAVVFCFVCEPVFVWLGIYRMLIWKSWYGLPLYFGIAVICRFAVRKVFAISGRVKKASSTGG